MKKVLLLTYYWPPAGGGGVQRWLKMSKYLSSFGWQPVIYTTENGETAAYDESLLREVRPDLEIIRTPIWEPYQVYKKFIGKKKEEKVYSGFISEGKKKTLAQKISIFIRGNFFIPDARCFWIGPSVKYLTEYIKTHQIDAIISTGPPHTMHRIGYHLKKKFPQIAWVADFRDPWTNIDFYDQLHLTWPADFMHRTLEKQVLKNANRVVTVSPSWAADFERLSGRKDILVITNGFDPEDFEKNVLPVNDITITHIGSMNEDRNPHVLWNALDVLNKEGKRFQVKLVGPVDQAIHESIKQKGLTDQVEHIPFVAHDRAIEIMQQSKILLLPINDTPNQAGVLPGKLYEYIGSNRCILCIGKGMGDAAKILSEFSQSRVVDYNATEDCVKAIKALSAMPTGELDQSKVDKYSRKSLASDYAKLLNQLTA